MAISHAVPMSQKNLLQIAVALGGLVPVAAGLAGILFGPGMTGDLVPAALSLDSHFRYLSGLLLGIGLFFWSTIPDIEHQGQKFRTLAAIVFVGGLARLYGILTVGIPNPGMFFGLCMELALTPALAFWQYRLAKSRGLDATSPLR